MLLLPPFNLPFMPSFSALAALCKLENNQQLVGVLCSASEPFACDDHIKDICSHCHRKEPEAELLAHNKCLEKQRLVYCYLKLNLCLI